MSLRNVSNVLVGSCAIEREAEIEIGPGYFKKLAQAIKARRLAASVAFATQKAELFEARLVAMQVASLTSSKDSFSDDSDGDELDEDEVAQIKARARLDNMLVPKVDQEYLSDDVNDDSSSDDSKPEYEDDAAITYLTHGIEGEVLKDRIARSSDNFVNLSLPLSSSKSNTSGLLQCCSRRSMCSLMLGTLSGIRWEGWTAL